MKRFGIFLLCWICQVGAQSPEDERLKPHYVQRGGQRLSLRRERKGPRLTFELPQG